MSSVYFDPAVGGDGSTVTDDANALTGLASGGHRTRFVPSMANIVGIGNFAKTKAAEAAASAASAVLSPGTYGTSSNAMTIGIGTYMFAIETGKNFVGGMTVKIANTTDWTQWMAGDVVGYTPGTGIIVVNVLVTKGAGTFGNWVVSLAGPLNGDPVLKSGGTMTGHLTILEPAGPMHPATAHYVDIHDKSPVIGRGANIALSASEHGYLVIVFSSFVQTIQPAATLGDGWYCHVQNGGAGIITLDPSGSETIDTKLTISVYPGESFILFCDGGAFYTSGRTLNPVMVSGGFSTVANLTIAQPFSDPEIKSFELWMELNPTGITNGMDMSVGGWAGAAGHIKTYYEFSSTYSISDRVSTSGTILLSGAGLSTDRISLYAECLDIQLTGEKPRFNVDVASVMSSVRRLRKNIVQSTAAAVKPTSMTVSASITTMTGTYRIVGSRV